MTAKKKPTPKKPPAAVAAPAATAIVDPVVLPLKDRVYDAFDEILAAYAGGWSLEYAVAMSTLSLDPGANALTVRNIINANKEMRSRWVSVRDARADSFFEKAAMQAEKLERDDPGKAGDLYLKLAAKQAPKVYGEKATVELTGADGGPLESVVKLSPADAYRRAMGKS